MLVLARLEQGSLLIIPWPGSVMGEPAMGEKLNGLIVDILRLHNMGVILRNNYKVSHAG